MLYLKPSEYIIDPAMLKNCLLLITALIALTLGACSSTDVTVKPSQADPHQQTQKLTAIDIAMQQLGVPYRYGGNNPNGFDCSGLVYYAYHQAGKQVPRSTREQYRYSKKLNRNELRPGDLVFFRISRSKVSHVGIYIGDNRFVHAPSSGKRVQISSLNNVYWKPRFISAGRL